MPLHPAEYAEMLGKKMQQHNVNVWLVNTGWTGGSHGTGHRMSLKYTRSMITAALRGELDKVNYHTHEIFGLDMPATCPDVPHEVLNPKQTWADADAYEAKANDLAERFNKNFKKFAAKSSDEILAAAPKVLAS
jgi:phosphoenolpyruvate carboxykinase (ATP)